MKEARAGRLGQIDGRGDALLIDATITFGLERE